MKAHDAAVSNAQPINQATVWTFRCAWSPGLFQPLPRTGPVCGSPGLPAPGQPSVLALQGLMHSSGPVGRHRQLVLVLEGELYLIPFALLKGSSSNEYLYERFTLIAVPSIRALGPQSKVSLWQA